MHSPGLRLLGTPLVSMVKPDQKKLLEAAGSRPFAPNTFCPGGGGFAFIKADLGFRFAHLPAPTRFMEGPPPPIAGTPTKHGF